jgi:hypothetical protein
VEDQQHLRHDIPVRNDRGRPVRFTNVRRSCSCAGAELLKKELAPGEETKLRLDISLIGRKGPQRFVCQLVEESGDEWTYTVETTLYVRAEFSGSGTTSFGLVDPNAPQSREVEFALYGKKREDLPESVSFESGTEAVRIASGLPSVETQPDGVVAKKYRLSVELMPPPVPGFAHTPLYARFQERGGAQEIHASVTWNVRALYSLSPGQAYFGKVAPTDAPVERRILVRRSDGEPLRINDVKASSPAITCRVDRQSEESFSILVLILEPQSLTGSLAATVTVETEDGRLPTIKIPAAAILTSQ